ncbi:Protein CBG26708 [Caenorhabditis briggsae]|uniref:Protein CBG26708 n=1 Tax=Caenorhabditis briggsae TaxID=6238 RepID=B6IE77_CAEBR|nr:Protein CBG26708 [Caenorhabditis briggsae]CAS01141.1 Protein CBG26708 [Caenorhabditis briggsae]
MLEFSMPGFFDEFPFVYFPWKDEKCLDESEKSGIRKIQNQIFAENFLLEIEQIEKLPVLQLDDVDFQNEPKESGNCGPKPGPKRMIAQLFQI